MNKITIPILSIEYDNPNTGYLKGYKQFGRIIDEYPLRCNKCNGKLNHIEMLESLLSVVIQHTGISNRLDFKESHYCESCKSSKEVKSLKIVIDEPVLDFPTLDV
jgi:hypothetical protein